MATQIKKTNAVKTANEKIEEKVEKISTEVEATTEKNSEVEKEMQKLREENAEKTKALDDLTRQFASMQELLNKMILNQDKKSKKTDEGDVLVGCRFVNGGSFATNNNRMLCKFDCDEEKYVSVEDLKTYLKESGRNYRNLFEIDGFYFVNPEDYEKFKIRKRVDLSHDAILEILSARTQNDLINRVNDLTNNLNDRNVLHLLEFEICKMIDDPKVNLSNWTYENRVALENYIGISFEELRRRLFARNYATQNRNK